MKWVKRLAIVVTIAVISTYVIVLIVLFVFQRELQYDRSGRMFALSETELTGTELVTIPNPDGSSVTGWYQPPAAGKPLILFFRGNAQSFSREHPRYEAFVADGYGYLAFDYRGFPGSPGEVTEEHVLEDALSAYDWAAARGFPIVIWGRSLGSGPATYVAGLRDADALLLETPFLSAVAVAADRYGFLPVGLLLHDQYPVSDWLRDVEEPVLVAHGSADTTINVSHGERVHALAPNPDELWIEPGADHAGLWDRGLWGRAKSFFSRAEIAAGRS